MNAAPLIVLLHAMGGSAESWREVTARLDGVECLAIDLPGFGTATADPRVTVEEMADMVVAAIRARAPTRWLIVGHSMGGKIASIVAARAERGRGPTGLVGVALFAASPPSPEPIDEERRSDMIDWVENGSIGEDHARTFVTNNTAGSLAPALFDVAVAGVRGSNPDAWRAWLTRGSREDWSHDVGRLDVSAIIVSGKEDGDLAAPAQHRLNGPHYRDAAFYVIDGAAHLLPLEAPDAVAALIRDHAARTAMPGVPADYAALLASDRVSARTRAIMLARAAPDDSDYRPMAIDDAQLATLRALVGRIIPDTPIDLAARIDVQLAQGQGEGWRFADLPADHLAYRAGLDTLASLNFVELDASAQDDLLRRIVAGDAVDGTLSSAQLEMWFENVRSAAVRLWISHPVTMARIGYDGIANGGDGVRKQGFQRTVADSREAWEPSR